MAKLKCWKKAYPTQSIGEGTSEAWDNLKNSKSILVLEPSDIGDKWVVAETSVESMIKKLKKTSSKPQAVKFAKSYMKKHDKC